MGSWSKFFSDVKEKSIFPFPVEGVFNAKDRVIRCYNINAPAGTRQQFVSQAIADFIVGICFYISEIGVRFYENGQRNMPELRNWHPIPPINFMKNSFL